MGEHGTEREETEESLRKAIEIIIKCIRWLLEAREEQWVGPKCLRIPCEEGCEYPDNKPNCIFNSARAVMALCKANYIWKYLKCAQEASGAITDAVTHLLDRAVEDEEFKPAETFYWWSSDMTLGEHRIEVVRATAAVVLALIEFKRFIESESSISSRFFRRDQLDRKIQGGVLWLRKAMIYSPLTIAREIGLPARIVPTTEKGVPGYQAFVYHGSWINIPIHIHESVHLYARRAKKRLRSKARRGLSAGAGQKMVAQKVEELFERQIAKSTGNKHLEACRKMMNVECVKRLIKQELPRAFNAECTKDALMALAMYDRELPEVQAAIQCLEKTRDRDGLWTELICMNFHTLVALLLAGVEPESDLIKETLLYLDNFKLGVEPDICLLVSKTLVDFYVSDMTKMSASKVLNEIIDEIRELRRRPEYGEHWDTSRMLCYFFREECAIPQTAWAVYTLGTVLEPLREHVHPTVSSFLASEEHGKKPLLAPTPVGRLQEAVSTTLDRLHKELTKSGYKPALISTIAGVSFSAIYDKSRFGQLLEVLPVQTFENIDKKTAKKCLQEFRKVKREEPKVKKIIISTRTKCEEEILNMFKDAEKEIGVLFDIRIET